MDHLDFMQHLRQTRVFCSFLIWCFMCVIEEGSFLQEKILLDLLRNHCFQLLLMMKLEEIRPDLPSCLKKKTRRIGEKSEKQWFLRQWSPGAGRTEIPEREGTDEVRPVIAPAFCLGRISICSAMRRNLGKGQQTV